MTSLLVSSSPIFFSCYIFILGELPLQTRELTYNKADDEKPLI